MMCALRTAQHLPPCCCFLHQVDIFSLGVVVFEMWHPFSTAMERVVLLRELRESGKMPPGWEAAHPQVARLIRCVMCCFVCYNTV
jgi:hypothetical protein